MRRVFNRRQRLYILYRTFYFYRRWPGWLRLVYDNLVHWTPDSSNDYVLNSCTVHMLWTRETVSVYEPKRQSKVLLIEGIDKRRLSGEY